MVGLIVNIDTLERMKPSQSESNLANDQDRPVETDQGIPRYTLPYEPVVPSRGNPQQRTGIFNK
ncbi:hypothetical protein CVT26_008300 [Gymnopilus dilepis]|uniref:Uncharacterized protein n=1 Tax=Gymnopilus dilepis TaxID=231916 RepID=A0A409W9E1_9AGAR|nr:hypothetical protein CVT26_008300 [Gymnopilus dilepis]